MTQKKKTRSAQVAKARNEISTEVSTCENFSVSDTLYQMFTSDVFGTVRTATIKGQYYFCATDVADALGYNNPWDAIKRHCKVLVKHEGVSSTTNQHGATTEQTVELNYIMEPDLYRLIMRSKLPAAEKFADWVFEDVLPAIRKTGRYAILAPKLGGATKPLWELTLNDVETLTEAAASSVDVCEFYSDEAGSITLACMTINTLKKAQLEQKQMLKDAQKEIFRLKNTMSFYRWIAGVADLCRAPEAPKGSE